MSFGMSAVSQKKVTFDWLFSNNINNSDKQSSETKINKFKVNKQKTIISGVQIRSQGMAVFVTVNLETYM